jgi:hypothetical protein
MIAAHVGAAHAESVTKDGPMTVFGCADGTDLSPACRDKFHPPRLVQGTIAKERKNSRAE